MNEPVILMRDALREMETGRVFSILFYMGNLSQETGEKEIEIERAVLNELRAGGATAADHQPIGKTEYLSTRARRHSKNRTCNIRILLSNEIRKIHISLFTMLCEKIAVLKKSQVGVVSR